MPEFSSPTPSEQDLKHNDLEKKNLDGEVQMVEAGESHLSGDLKPGLLSLEEDAAGGMGRHLGLYVYSTLFIILLQLEKKNQVDQMN